jgi:hypothetical protein
MGPQRTPPEPSCALGASASSTATPTRAPQPRVRAGRSSTILTVLAVLGVTTPVWLACGVDLAGMLTTEAFWPLLLVPGTLLALFLAWMTNGATREDAHVGLASVQGFCLVLGPPALALFAQVLLASAGPHT